MVVNRMAQIWKWAVVLLVLCNIGLIAVMLLRPSAEGGRKRETPRDFVIHNLKFSDEQVKQYDVMIKDHQEAMHRLRRGAMEYRQALFAKLKSDNGNNTNADSLAQLIANTQKQIEVVTYQHFRQVREICTEAQKAEFDGIIGDVIKKMNGHGHGGPPPPDGQGPPPPGGEGDGDRPPGERRGPPPPEGR